MSHLLAPQTLKAHSLVQETLKVKAAPDGLYFKRPDSARHLTWENKAIAKLQVPPQTWLPPESPRQGPSSSQEGAY